MCSTSSARKAEITNRPCTIEPILTPCVTGDSSIQANMLIVRRHSKADSRLSDSGIHRDSGHYLLPTTTPTYPIPRRCITQAYILESYSNLGPLRHPASNAHETRTRGVSVYDCGLAPARKPR